MGQEPAVYDASHITVLEGYQAVRKRPGMYIGSAGERGLYAVVLEAAGWGIDEVLAGRAGRVEVTLLGDGGVRVADDGPGADIGDLTTALTVLTAGWSSVGGRYPMRSLMGQLLVVNALSRRLVAVVRREGEEEGEGSREVREFERGVLVASDGLTVSPDTSPAASGPDSAALPTGHGTTLTFWPDPDIFETTVLSFEVLAERFRELAFLYRELEFLLVDERSEPRSLRLRFPGGVREMVAFLDGDGDADADDDRDADAESDIISFERHEAAMAGVMEIAWWWHGSGGEQARGYANTRPTPEGGTHVLGFRDGVAAALTAWARERELLASTDPDIGGDGIGAGLTAVVSVKLEYPEFEGCTWGALGNVDVRGYVRRGVEEHFGAWLAEHPQQAARILAQILTQLL